MRIPWVNATATVRAARILCIVKKRRLSFLRNRPLAAVIRSNDKAARPNGLTSEYKLNPSIETVPVKFIRTHTQRAFQAQRFSVLYWSVPFRNQADI